MINYTKIFFCSTMIFFISISISKAEIFIVQNTNSSDAGSLIQAIADANSTSRIEAGIFAYTQYINKDDCVIKDNDVSYLNSGGGGIYLWSWAAQIESCLIENNINQVCGAERAINSNGYFINPSIIDNTFTNVNPTWGGGKIYNVGNLILENCTAVNDNSDEGGSVGNFSLLPTDRMITLCHTIDVNNSATDGNELYGLFGSLDYYLIEDVSRGTITSDDGTILHTTNGGISTIEDKIYLLNTFNLEQNYPNPFNLPNKIQYTISSGQFVSLKVYDLLGNRVVALDNEEKLAGSYEFEFNPSYIEHYPASGVYFCHLQSDRYSKTIKMLYLK